jgi:hypothetical protein
MKQQTHEPLPLVPALAAARNRKDATVRLDTATSTNASTALQRNSRHRRGLLEDSCDSLLARITEAEREGWTGEAEGPRVSLAASNNKLAQAATAAGRRSEAVNLGIPPNRHPSRDPARRSPP